jgi:hypothetical protein
MAAPVAQDNVINLNVNRRAKTLAAQPGFEALLAGFDAKAKPNDSFEGLLNGFVDNILSNIGGNFGTEILPEVLNSKFPFTAEFEMTFGLSGPLPAYIAVMSERLNLSAEQNLAFQQIAVDNKDITRTPENVAKIRAELKTAGIGYNLVKS